MRIDVYISGDEAEDVAGRVCIIHRIVQTPYVEVDGHINRGLYEVIYGEDRHTTERNRLGLDIRYGFLAGINILRKVK